MNLEFTTGKLSAIIVIDDNRRELYNRLWRTIASDSLALLDARQ